MYKCHFPNCPFSSESRSKIDHHHLTPREVDPNTKITIPLCKNHHALIFHPKAKHGQHSINTSESIEILNIFKSTGGEALHYKDYNGNKFYYFFESKDIVKD